MASHSMQSHSLLAEAYSQFTSGDLSKSLKIYTEILKQPLELTFRANIECTVAIMHFTLRQYRQAEELAEKHLCSEGVG